MDKFIKCLVIMTALVVAGIVLLPGIAGAIAGGASPVTCPGCPGGQCPPGSGNCPCPAGYPPGQCPCPPTGCPPGQCPCPTRMPAAPAR